MNIFSKKNKKTIYFIFFFLIPITIVFKPHNVNQLHTTDISLGFLFIILIIIFTIIGGLIAKLIFNYKKLIDACLITQTVIGIFFHFAIIDFTLSTYFNFKSSYYALSLIIILSFFVFFFQKEKLCEIYFLLFFFFYQSSKVLILE